MTRHNISASPPPQAMSWRGAVFFLALGFVLAKLHSSRGLPGLTWLRPACVLGDICVPFANRPPLRGGRLASPMWDVPRRLLLHPDAPPAAPAKHQWSEPRALWFASSVSAPHLRLLAAQARKLLAEQPDVVPTAPNGPAPVVEMAALPAHQLESYAVAIFSHIARSLGFPSAHYIESVRFLRYDLAVGTRPTRHHLNPERLQRVDRFHGCQRAAVARLMLARADAGGAELLFNHSESGAPQHAALRAECDVGDVLAWFVMHPMTEEVDERVWHGVQPVTHGVKLVAELLVRNCSWKANRRRVAALKLWPDGTPEASAQAVTTDSALEGEVGDDLEAVLDDVIEYARVEDEEKMARVDDRKEADVLPGIDVRAREGNLEGVKELLRVKEMIEYENSDWELEEDDSDLGVEGNRALVEDEEYLEKEIMAL